MNLIVLVLCVAITMGGCAGSSQTRTDMPPTFLIGEGQVDRAKEVLASADDQYIVEYFRLLPLEPPRRELEARELYILGRAYFKIAENEIKVFRSGGNPGMGSLPQRSVDMLLIARNNLLAAADAQPNADFAPEAFYRAGQAMDHGFLQDFQGAMEIYQWAASAYPASIYGGKAANRYQGLLLKFKDTRKPSH